MSMFVFILLVVLELTGGGGGGGVIPPDCTVIPEQTISFRCKTKSPAKWKLETILLVIS